MLNLEALLMSALITALILGGIVLILAWWIDAPISWFFSSSNGSSRRGEGGGGGFGGDGDGDGGGDGGGGGSGGG
ncbi:hypothetical protein AB0I61_32360 [Polymorphospora rubra]|uniref:hypothetical protein n=1 Tax=Polymorphospora rubra TaxID=338584 RepID=UPI0033F62729